MRKIAALTAITVFVAIGGFALAESDKGVCQYDRQSQPISADTMAKKIDQLGYNIRRLRADDGCFKAQIVERQTGGVVEATFSRTSGELLHASLAF